jgi:hypothetical protein
MNAELRRLVDALPALVWSALPDGRAEFFNQYYLDFVGLSAEQAKDWGWAVAVHPDDLAGLTATWLRILASDAPGEAEARLRRADGEYRWCLFRANPVRDEAGKTVRWYGTNADIDDHKRSEEAIAALREALARANRLASLTALTASVAHEVSQPLAGIMLNANTCLRMLAATPPDVDGAMETARRTIRDGNRAAEVITRLRGLFGRRDAPNDLVDLNEATREVLALSTSELQRNRVVLRVELADGLPPVVGDRIQLQQVVLHLVSNAVDAMTAVNDRPRQLTVRTEQVEGDRVRLTVEDSGVGIDPEQVGRLFEPFYTTKPSGMGVGLAVSRSIIDSHGGTLWAAPNDGPGTTFAFSIPTVIRDR